MADISRQVRIMKCNFISFPVKLLGFFYSVSVNLKLLDLLSFFEILLHEVHCVALGLRTMKSSVNAVLAWNQKLTSCINSFQKLFIEISWPFLRLELNYCSDIRVSLPYSAKNKFNKIFTYYRLIIINIVALFITVVIVYFHRFKWFWSSKFGPYR